MGANDPQGMASLDRRGLTGRIYVGDYLTLLQIQYISGGLMVLKKFFFKFFPLYLCES